MGLVTKSTYLSCLGPELRRTDKTGWVRPSARHVGFPHVLLAGFNNG